MNVPKLIVLFLLLLGSNTVLGAMQSLQYDSNGNLVSGQGLYYEYNDANKLIRVREGASDGRVIGEYWYDYRGQRVKKVENGITTYYIGKQYEERRGQSVNEQTNFYFAGGQRVARKTKSSNDPGKTSFYLNNHLGSADLVTDSSGTVVNAMEFFPYGAVRNNGDERYGYTGKEKDRATGLNYYESRYYNTESLHFTQADTVTPNVYDPQSLNRYSYVKNNPIKFIDPNGHSWKNFANGAKEFFAKIGISTYKSITWSSEKTNKILSGIADGATSTMTSKDYAALGVTNKINKAAKLVGIGEKVADQVEYNKNVDQEKLVSEEFKESKKQLGFFENIGSLLTLGSPGASEQLGEHTISNSKMFTGLTANEILMRDDGLDLYGEYTSSSGTYSHPGFMKWLEENGYR